MTFDTFRTERGAFWASAIIAGLFFIGIGTGGDQGLFGTFRQAWSAPHPEMYLLGTVLAAATTVFVFAVLAIVFTLPFARHRSLWIRAAWGQVFLLATVFLFDFWRYVYVPH